MVLGLATAAMAAGAGRFASLGLMVFAVAALVLVFLDQQRLQPWTYQFMLVAIVLAWAKPADALALLRLLVISFYFHSAVTKLDYTFLHTLGQQFLAALAGTLGASLEAVSPPARAVTAALFPVAELLIAVGLCFTRTRGAALAGAIVLHTLLLVILGPWGLDHKPGVLVWNVYFIVQDVVLFWTPRRPPRVAPRGAARSVFRSHAPWGVQATIVAAVVLPLLAPTSWFDLWPSWGLYASCAQRVQLVVHRRELAQLPDALRCVAEASSDPLDPWLNVRLDRWALAVLGAPIYPQNRYQLGVAEAAIVRYGLVHRVRVLRFGLADRLTGEREHDVLPTLAKISAAANEYTFNARPNQALFAP
jgi:hypothetical protein